MKLKGYTEEEIAKIMAFFAKEYLATLWSDNINIKPEIIAETQGDGLQVVYLEPLDTRPNYYVLRIDSSIDIDNDEIVHYNGEEIYIAEMLLQLVETQHNTIDSYTEINTNEGTRYFLDEEEENLLTVEEVAFPVLHWSGGCWGAMKDVSYLLPENN